MNPYESKMWHHKFDPHQVPAVPLADLKTQATRTQRSESVKDFLNRNKLSSLIEPTSNQNLRLVEKSLDLRPSVTPVHDEQKY